MLDGLVCLVCGLPFALAIVGIPGKGQDAAVGSAWWWHFVLVGNVVSFLYFTLMEGTRGQTLGKKQLGVRVVKADGSPMDLQAAFTRNLLRIVDQLPTLYAYGLWRMTKSGPARRQRLGDSAAGTLVVAASPAGPRMSSSPSAAQRLTRWAVAISVVVTAFFVLGLVVRPSVQSQHEAAFVTGCEQGQSSAFCHCLYTQLGKNGYSTTQQMIDLKSQLTTAIEEHNRAALPAGYLASIESCRAANSSG